MPARGQPVGVFVDHLRPTHRVGAGSGLDENDAHDEASLEARTGTISEAWIASLRPRGQSPSCPAWSMSCSATIWGSWGSFAQRYVKRHGLVQPFQAEFGGCPSMVRENTCSAPDPGRGRWYPSQIVPVPLNTAWAAHTVSLSPAHRNERIHS